MERIIFHVDVNSAFLSWEAARQVAQGKEDLRLIPAAVGGDRDKRTGVILAKSMSAKKLGVTTGQSVASALRLCPALKLVKPDFELYVRNSAAFMNLCRDYTNVLEKYSIDECFLDMTDTTERYPDSIALAFLIKNRIRDELGFTVNVGIGPNKLLAKMASDFTKPDKVHTLFTDEISAKLWPLPVEELFTVGRATADKLRRNGIFTIGALAQCSLQRVQNLIGQKHGALILNYARGIDDSPVIAVPEAPKGYAISTTLEQDVTTAHEARRILTVLCDSVAARMRADKMLAMCVGVTIRDRAFKNSSHQMRLLTPTDITSEIRTYAHQLFAELWDGRTPMRLIGVSLTGLTNGSLEQRSLFNSAQREQARRLDRAIDKIRRHLGAHMIIRCSELNSELEVGRKYKAQMGIGHQQ